jgi:hypothetical protein
MTDPKLFRALSSVQTMLRRPAEVLAEAEVADQIRAAFAAGTIVRPPTGPSRTDILAALEAAH